MRTVAVGATPNRMKACKPIIGSSAGLSCTWCTFSRLAAAPSLLILSNVSSRRADWQTDPTDRLTSNQRTFDITTPRSDFDPLDDVPVRLTRTQPNNPDLLHLWPGGALTRSPLDPIPCCCCRRVPWTMCVLTPRCKGSWKMACWRYD